MAVTPRSIARALPPVAPSNPGSVMPTYAGGGSPMVATYDMWASGRVAASPLPRNPMEFLSGAYGPLSPITPMPLDTPRDGADRAEPRRFQYPVGWNLPHGQPGDEGLKLASFAHLRTVADTYSVARACIRIRIQEIVGLEWDIVPTKAAEKAMRNDNSARRDFEERCAKIRKFWKRPDPNYFRFGSWFNALLEDMFVLDALSLYLHPSRGRGKGVMGSDLAALDIIDGATIRPLLDVHGAHPKPPNPAYAQYLYGVPRTDLLTVLADEDIKDLGEQHARDYRGDQLLYLPYESRTWTPYGNPPAERALMPILAGMQRQQYQLQYFEEGSVPSVFISAGESSTPSQCRELQDALNAMAGDPAWKHKIIVIPGGSKVDPMRPVDLASAFDEIIMVQTCMAFDVMPMELGISPRTSSSQSSGAANQMAKTSGDINDRKARKPVLRFLSDIFDSIIQDVCGQPDMRFLWEGLEEGVDEAAQVELLDREIRVGLRSVDEARAERGEKPWGLPLTSDPVFFTAAGPVPFSQPASTLTEQAPDQGKPAETVPADDEAEPTRSPAHAGAGAAEDKTPGGSTGESARKVATPEALRELDLIRRRLTRGRSLIGWKPKHITLGMMAGITGGMDAGGSVDDVISRARAAVKGATGRDGLIAVEDRVVAALDTIGARLTSGDITRLEFVDRAVSVLRDGIRTALTMGATDALAGTVTKAVKPTPGSRYRMYAGRVWGAYEQAYVLTLAAIHDGRVEIRWKHEPDACTLCEDRSKSTFTLDTLPGWPGDGGFGELCAGGPLCRCTLGAVRTSSGESPRRAGYAPIRDAISAAGEAVSATSGALASALSTMAGQLAEAQRIYMVGLAAAMIAAGLTSTGGRRPETASKGASNLVAAGLVVRAADTGRVLMLQRAISDDDPAGGCWEFPGGGIEPNENPVDAARREWAEETGCPTPDGEIVGEWTSRDGVYRGHVLVVPSESVIPAFGDRDQVTNPDDPDGDWIEALAWWDPNQLPGNPAVRAELLADMDLVLLATLPT